MPQRARAADGFKSQSAEQLVATAVAAITSLTNNPAFPAPTVDLKAVQAADDHLNSALAAQAPGGPVATAEKNNGPEALVIVLCKLKHYVEDNCGNDRITIADLVPGTTWVFQVRAVGGSSGHTDWSNPISRMCGQFKNLNH